MGPIPLFEKYLKKTHMTFTDKVKFNLICQVSPQPAERDRCLLFSSLVWGLQLACWAQV